MNISISNIPLSKSYANRILIDAFINGEDINKLEMPLSDDVQNLIKSLNALSDNQNSIELGEGGTTIRFFLVLVASLGKKLTLKVHPRFKLRPIEPLFELLEAHGTIIKRHKADNLLCDISGKFLPSTSLKIDCSQTTQFLSALLLCQKIFQRKVQGINIKGSRPYLEMTQFVVDRQLRIVPVDFSCASYFIAFAYLNRDILFTQIKKRDVYQADDCLIDLLIRHKGKFDFSAQGLKVFQRLDLSCDFSFDVTDCPDLAMTIIYLCLFTIGEHKLTGLESLKFKEINRLEGICSILDQLGADYNCTDSSILIRNNHNYYQVERLTAPPDHRMVMMAQLIGYQLGVKVDCDAQVVKKSFPGFFEVLKSII